MVVGGALVLVVSAVVVMVVVCDCVSVVDGAADVAAVVGVFGTVVAADVVAVDVVLGGKSVVFGATN